MERRDRDVNGIGHIFSLKDTSLDITLGEDRDLLGKLELFDRFDEIQTA